jgi:hypothetical protein
MLALGRTNASRSRWLLQPRQVNRSFRSRFPVAAKIAFAIAGMIADVPDSPMPPGALLFCDVVGSTHRGLMQDSLMGLLQDGQGMTPISARLKSTSE